MGKTMKKILCTLLVVVMCLTSVPLSGFVGLEWPDINIGEWFGSKASAAEKYTKGYYTYTVTDGKATITDVNTSISGDIIIPATLGGYSVTTIGGCAFWGCDSLTSITIPDSVTTIGHDAFYGCDSLTSISIPDSVTTIGDYAFRDCYSLTSITVDINNVAYSNDIRGVLFDKNKTVLIKYPVGNNISYTIPDSVTTIGAHSFSYCDSLTSVTIPDSVTTIGGSAFGYCDSLTYVYYQGTEEQWKEISIGGNNERLTGATIHYNYKPAPTSYFMVSSDQYSVDSINGKENATYKINLLDANSDFLSIDDVTFKNNTIDIVAVSMKKVSDTELELTVEPLKDGDASISLFNGDGSIEQFFNFTVYSNTTTYRADQVPVTDEKLKTNFSRGDMTVDNFTYYFDENKGKYIATMDVYNSSGAIGVVAAYTQEGKISDIQEVAAYKPLPSDFGEFLAYLGTGAISIARGENWNYRYSGYCKKTTVEIEVPADGYITVSCDVTSCSAAFIYNLVSIGVDAAFKTASIIDKLGSDTDDVAKKATKAIANKVAKYFNEDSEWTEKAMKKLAKKLSKSFNVAYLENISMLSMEMLDELCENAGYDFSKLVFDVIFEITKEEIKEFGVMTATKKLIKDKVIGVAEASLLKVASAMFDGGEYINLANQLLGAYLYNWGSGKTMIVFEPKGETGFLCKDTVKVISDVITEDVLLNTYILNVSYKSDAFLRDKIYPEFNREDGLDEKELNIDLNRVVEIHEISLYKNGVEIDSTFKATVEMDIPSYINNDTCFVYRVEKNGTCTKLKTRIEGNKIIFETDHFSEYILTGVIEDLQETTPCDVHVYNEVRAEPSCTEAGSITYTCYCGDTYTETIPATGHTFDGSKCTSCGYDKADECDCNCHASGIKKFFFKLILFFQKLFKKNAVCACGVAHY